MSQAIDFIVPGRPQGKARPRFSKTGHAYTLERTRRYENFIRAEADNAVSTWQVAHRRFWEQEGNFSVAVTAYFPVPKSWSKRKRAAALRGDFRPTCKPDADNIAKAVLDGLNGVAFRDDRMVGYFSIAKVFAVDAPEGLDNGEAEEGFLTVSVFRTDDDDD